MDFNLYKITKQRQFLSLSYNVILEDSILYRVSKKSIFDSTLIVSNIEDQQILEIRNVAVFSSMELQIIDNENKVIAVLKDKPFSNKLDVTTIEGPMNIIGNLMSTEFTIIGNETEIAKISIHKYLKSKYLGMAVSTKFNQLLIVGMTIALEMKLNIQGQSF